MLWKEFEHIQNDEWFLYDPESDFADDFEEMAHFAFHVEVLVVVLDADHFVGVAEVNF